MRNDEVAALLYEIADLLEMSDEDPFRPISYRRAARSIEALPEAIEDLAKQGRLREIPGVGEAISEKVKKYLAEGRLDYLEELRQRFPAGLADIMRIPGVGPRTARQLFAELQITNLDELREAAEKGRLRRLKGFKEKSEENILKGIRLIQSGRGKALLGDALPIAERIVEHLRTHAAVDRVSFAGSVRRMKEQVGDIDVLVTTTEPAAVTNAFVTMPLVREVIASGDTKSSVRVAEGIQVDLRVLEPTSWGSGLMYFTGSKDHNIKLRTHAQKRGLKLSEYGLFREEVVVAAASEEDVYRALDLPYIEPEMREDTGEVEAAMRGALPSLVTLQDIRGDLHAHTNLTDGVNTLEEMADAARRKGYAYLGISDHSPSLRVASGLSVDHLRIHVAHIREYARKNPGLHLLAGTECDILPDGTLDYPDAVLKDMDYVIGAVHQRLKQPEKEMTARILRAMENEHLDILAHPTARKIGQREPIAANMEKVIRAAADTGTVLEVNAYPDRSDLNGAYAKMAKEAGAKLIVDTDSHTTQQLDYMRLGVGLARRGWLEKADVVNTMSYEDILRFFGRAA